MSNYEFLPSREAGLERLKAFLPFAGKNYTALRNYDLGQNNHRHVSMLSPYIRHSAMTVMPGHMQPTGFSDSKTK